MIFELVSKGRQNVFTLGSFYPSESMSEFHKSFYWHDAKDGKQYFI